MDDTTYGLAEAIAALRADLTAAAKQGRDQQLQFRMEPVELTLQTVVTKGLGGEIGWRILGLGGSGSYVSAATHTLKLRLAPQTSSDPGGDFTVASSTEAEDSFGAPAGH